VWKIFWAKKKYLILLSFLAEKIPFGGYAETYVFKHVYTRIKFGLIKFIRWVFRNVVKLCSKHSDFEPKLTFIDTL
jgi:hypothetical protein